MINIQSKKSTRSTVEEEGDASGFGMGRERGTEDDMLFDDEDLGDDNSQLLDSLSSASFSLSFACEYSIETGNPISQMADNIKYELRLFEDSNFHQKVDSFPATVTENQMLFVEAVLHSDSEMGLLIKECKLGVLLPNSETSFHNVLQNGCPSSEMSTTLLEEGLSGATKRFGFQVPRLRDQARLRDQGQILMFQCELVASSTASHSLPHCMTQSKYCQTNQDPGESLFKTVGPLLLNVIQAASAEQAAHQVREPPPHQGERKASVESSGVTTKCAQVIHVEGLNSSTVVGIAFAAFIIGIALTGAIWYIHTCTVPIKKHINGLRFPDASGESTPNSNAPVSIRPLSQRHRV